MALVRKRLGELLVEACMITDDQLKQCLEEQARTNESLGQILIKNGFVTESNIKDALELQYGINYVNPKHVNITPEVLAMVPENLIRQHLLFPISFSNNRLTLAMVDPTNLPAIDDVRFRLGKNISINSVVITEDDFYRFLEQYFKVEEKAPEVKMSDVEDTDELISELGDAYSIEDAIEEQEGDDSSKNTAPIIRLSNNILVQALNKKCSDIHIEPQEKYIRLRYRKDGVLQEESRFPKNIAPALAARFKIMSNLDISEKRVPQDGRLRKIINGKVIDFRVSSLPSKFGEKICMRILDKSNTTLGLDKLFIYDDMLRQVREFTSRPYGIIFVTGPTGSGKTTSLYSILAERNTVDVNISTAEDPIEYDLEGITQTQAQPGIGLTFARILKAFLRQDPDIMLIGETRDKELAHIAIESALTGHLVFTSLHTNDAPGAITRLQEMGIPGFLTSSATIGVIAQRLVRRICGKCKIKYNPSKEELDYVGWKFYEKDKMVEIYKANPDGCSDCNKGYKGRMGVYEVLQFNDEIREVVNREGTKSQIRAAAKKTAGMVPLKDYSLKLVRDGHTDLAEVIRVTMTDEGEEKLCTGCSSVVEENWVRCPYCLTSLRESCQSCGAFVQKEWLACVQCGVKIQKKPDDTHSHYEPPKPKATESHPSAELDFEAMLAQSSPASSTSAKCPTCLAEVQKEWDNCPYCHTVLN
ncbi:MAG: ATPase, T2SS/T4P/T4SS family [Candidatus Sericytochromatia bacterium]